MKEGPGLKCFIYTVIDLSGSLLKAIGQSLKGFGGRGSDYPVEVWHHRSWSATASTMRMNHFMLSSAAGEGRSLLCFTEHLTS
ncbi:hypothetical protein D3C80_1538500 [compost metagenome]